MRTTFDSIRRGRRRALVVAAVALALAIAGVASGVALATAGGHRLRGHGAEIEAHDFAFHPGKITVARGTRITIANHDSTTHTATSPGSFDTGRIKPGHAASVTLRKAGVYAFHCTIHPFMHGKIVVR
jgi:plastocyanin